MRDPNRLYGFYDELRRIHMEHVPNWRFGQMISNIFHDKDIFYMEEDEILKRIRKHFEK